MELKSILESLFFAADNVLNVKDIQSLLKEAATYAPGPETEAFKKVKEDEIEQAIHDLQKDYQENGRSFQLQELAGGFQLGTRQEFSIWVAQLFEGSRASRLSQPALETLAIIAYRQPISRADIESVRGVAVDGVVATLLERKLIKIAGRANVPGKPLIYETTAQFLEQFGLKDINELPNSDELRRVMIQKSAPAQEQQPELINETPIAEETDRPAGQPAS
jgi:segregation and condensation protein B